MVVYHSNMFVWYLCFCVLQTTRTDRLLMWYNNSYRENVLQQHQGLYQQQQIFLFISGCSLKHKMVNVLKIYIFTWNVEFYYIAIK